MIKAGVSLSLLVFLLYKIDWGKIRQHISLVDLEILSVVFLILIVQFPISAYKWKKSLEIFKLHFPYLFLLKVLCIGFFVNSFLPTNIGGDGYRALKTMPSGERKSLGILPVLLERVVGIAVLVGLGLAGAIVTLMEYRQLDRGMVLLAGILLAAFTVLALAFAVVKDVLHHGRPPALVRGIVSRIRKFDLVHRHGPYLQNGGKRFLQLVQVSTVFQALAVASIYLLFRSIGVEAGMSECAFIAALAGIASLMPVSINGIGVAEGSFVFSSVQVGIRYDEAVVVAFMLRILTTLLTLACGIVFLYDSGKSPRRNPERPDHCDVSRGAERPRRLSGTMSPRSGRPPRFPY